MITEVSEVLLEAGISPTPQRLSIYKAVAGRTDHPCVDKVYNELKRKIPSLSRTTVYKTMQLFADHHLIGRVSIEDGEVRYDGSPHFHAHFKCRGCGKLYDIEVPGRVEKTLAEIPEGFEMDEEQLLYFGTCKACLKKQKGQQQQDKAKAKSTTKEKQK